MALSHNRCKITAVITIAPSADRARMNNSKWKHSLSTKGDISNLEHCTDRNISNYIILVLGVLSAQNNT